MYCITCGQSIAPDVSFCPNCRTPVPVQGVPAVSALPSGYVPTYGVPVGPIPQTEASAVVSLVLGIVSMFALSVLAGIPAIILGRSAQRNIRASQGRLTGEGLAQAGIVLGWISVGLLAVTILFVLIIALVISSH